MAEHVTRARSGLIWLIVAVLIATFLAPLSALADTNLEIGGTAVIAYANGDDVRLRQDPGYDGDVIRMVREGAAVDVLDGPFEDSDGNLWYQVSFDGDSGYIVSDYLALNSGASSADQESVFNPAGDAIGAALIAGTNNDGVRCRADADPGAAVITVVPEGTIVEITGGAIDVWQPINCAGQGGYVHTDYVSWDIDGGSAEESADVEATSVIGEAIVAGTNGDGVRCRASASYSASIITVLSEDSSVSLRDIVRGDFQGVVCAGQNGYAASMYLSTDGSGGVDDAAGGDVTGEAVVSGTNGDGVRCRNGAGFDASVITVLSEGTSVALRGDASDGWQPVICAGSNGYISTEFLSSGGGGGGGGDDVTGAAVISGTNGDGVRCRSQASFSGDVITVLSEGTDVDLRGDQEGDWVPVVCSGANGWVHADYVGSGGGGGGDNGGGSSNSSFSSGDVAVVAGTNGDGVRLRSSASTNAAVISVLSEGTSVTVIDGSTGDWVAVSVAGTSGFVHMDYLSASAGEGDDGGSSGGALGAGERAITTSTLNLRYDPSFSGGIAAVAPQGIVVAITGNASDGFYPVDWDGLQGYMHGDYLSWTDESLSERGGSGDGGGSTDGGGGGGGGAGNSSIVDYAMQYLGYPYVWATAGPSSFDCSGFTYWVMKNTLGLDIGRGLFTQVELGTPVSRDDLQPGDLVFFQNTYTWGLSHNGIYIGNGKFIHAENESTGVLISDIDSNYYASRWYGARRIG